MDKTIISTIQIRDFNQVKDISDRCFGVNYLSINQLNKLISIEGFYLKLSVNSIVVGFCLAQKISIQQIKSDFYISETGPEKFGIIRTIAIVPEYQRKGMGSALLKKMVHKMEITGKFSNIYYPSWVESHSAGFTKIIKREGFVEVGIYKNYWSNDSIAQNFKCIKCGNPPCNCSMQLYKRIIEK